jgi:MoaA/NifB/PqqE/SkfB family radical SAM enzyme
MNSLKKIYDQRFPPKFPGLKPLPEKWKNTVKGCHVESIGPGLYMMDVEHIPPAVAARHNDSDNNLSLINLYRGRICIHNCPSCFNEEAVVYGKENKILTLSQTMQIIDCARQIARDEGHKFEIVKFLGPGELLMNPELFKIIDEYAKRGIFLNIFTKGALLGNDRLANKFQGHMGIKDSKSLVDHLAAYSNVGLIFSFQSFNSDLQDSLVTSFTGGKRRGLPNQTEKRDRALEHIFSSAFFRIDGTTQRFSLINAPIVPENIDESFDIYKFAIEHGTPIVSTPTMISGKGSTQVEKQTQGTNAESWYEKIIELYSDIYIYNVLKGIQTSEQIEREGISPYAGLMPCSQVALGLYFRANGIIQMCPGRFDRETVFGNVFDKSLEEIWMNSSNRTLGMDPDMRFNNHCPAKDSTNPEQNHERTFPFGFYDKVLERFKEKLGK